MENAALLAAARLHQERRGNLPDSIVRRQGAIRTLGRWLGTDRSLLTATTDEIERFLDDRHIGSRTRYTYLSHFECFYRWAVDEGLLKQNPVHRIIRPKLRRHLPRPASTVELMSALAGATQPLRCWIVLAAFQGLRCQEVAGLRREDVLTTEGLLRVVKGKGGHERLVPLHPEVLVELQRLPMPRQGWIFTRPMGGPYSPAILSATFNQGLRELEVDATAHQLRHWFGTNLYAATHDLRMVQEMLGHQNPATTAIYTAFDPLSARKAVSALSFGTAIVMPFASKGTDDAKT